MSKSSTGPIFLLPPASSASLSIDTTVPDAAPRPRQSKMANINLSRHFPGCNIAANSFQGISFRPRVPARGLCPPPFISPTILRGGAASFPTSSDGGAFIPDDDNEYIDLDDNGRSQGTEASATPADTSSSSTHAKADSLIHDFEAELIKIRQQIELEAEEELMAWRQKMLEKRREKRRVQERRKRREEEKIRAMAVAAREAAEAEIAAAEAEIAAASAESPAEHAFPPEGIASEPNLNDTNAVAHAYALENAVSSEDEEPMDDPSSRIDQDSVPEQTIDSDTTHESLEIDATNEYIDSGIADTDVDVVDDGMGRYDIDYPSTAEDDDHSQSRSIIEGYTSPEDIASDTADVTTEWSKNEYTLRADTSDFGLTNTVPDVATENEKEYDQSQTYPLAGADNGANDLSNIESTSKATSDEERFEKDVVLEVASKPRRHRKKKTKAHNKKKSKQTRARKATEPITNIAADEHNSPLSPSSDAAKMVPASLSAKRKIILYAAVLIIITLVKLALVAIVKFAV